MFPLFLRARAQRYVSGLFEKGKFKARSPGRDAETDRARVDAIVSAIGEALSAAEREQAGIKRRLDDVVARAGMSVGYEVDEYLDREPHKTQSLNFFDAEIVRAESRIKELKTMVSHFQFLKAATLTRFPSQSSAEKKN
jgi:hypothetical protein